MIYKLKDFVTKISQIVTEMRGEEDLFVVIC